MGPHEAENFYHSGKAAAYRMEKKIITNYTSDRELLSEIYN